MGAMQLIPLGDCAVLVVLKVKGGVAALEAVSQLALKLRLAPPAGVTDIVPSFSTVTVHYDPVKVPAGEGAPVARVMRWIQSAPAVPAKLRRKAREVVVPVCYGGEQGPDIAAVAAHAKMTEAEVIRVHSKAAYRVAAVGFSPGFPYLLGLAPRLATPRKATPRTVVAAGSVGIGGAQTGIYPTATPGGWSLIGRTPLRLFRPENEAAPTLLEAGDSVKFLGVTEKQAAQLEEKSVAPAAVRATKESALFEVIKAGVLTTVQDLGRPGRQHQGIPVGGAMDRQAARVANLLLGNDENDALLEVTLTGPVVRFSRDAGGGSPWRAGVASVESGRRADRVVCRTHEGRARLHRGGGRIGSGAYFGRRGDAGECGAGGMERKGVAGGGPARGAGRGDGYEGELECIAGV